MKRTWTVLTALLLVMVMLVSFPVEASAATKNNHDGSKFTIGEKSFVKQYQKHLKDNGLNYTFYLEKNLSDSNFRHYILKDSQGSYTMSLSLYLKGATKKLETIRLNFDPRYCTEDQQASNTNAMLLAYEVANQYMNDVDWDRLFSDGNMYSTHDGYGISGTLYGVYFQMTLGSEDVQLLIE